MGWTEAEDIKRWQKYPEQLYKKDLHDPDNHDGVITNLEPDMLECKVKWALGSITTNKASGGDGILAELFQILKDDAVRVLHSICPQIWKTQEWPQDWTRWVFIPIPKKGNAKECSNYHTMTLILHASKVMLKTLQPRLQQYMNWELPDVQAGFRKGRETDIKLPNSTGSLKKQENSRKTSTSASLTTLKSLTVWITANCGNFLKSWKYQTTLPASWETCMQVKQQQLEPDMNNGLVPSWERSTSRLYPCLFNLYAEHIMQNARLDEAQAGIKIAKKISITSDMQMTPPLWQKVKRN